MRTDEVDGKTYQVKNESVNEGNYTFAIADGMYDLHTIHTLENAGLECHIDKGEGNELVCRSNKPIHIKED
ncbi:MAG: hypothetical protein MJZ62_00250 [Bacteroidales bacterium]|nr:hypothetical protein [Bacteroidales bacterium]